MMNEPAEFWKERYKSTMRASLALLDGMDILIKALPLGYLQRNEFLHQVETERAKIVLMQNLVARVEEQEVY
jgi:hypothetical protein